jgi:hypothetical protein
MNERIRRARQEQIKHDEELQEFEDAIRDLPIEQQREFRALRDNPPKRLRKGVRHSKSTDEKVKSQGAVPGHNRPARRPKGSK